MTKAQFDKWVERMIKQYDKDNDILIRLFGSTTYIAYDFKTQRTSIARCHPKDIFNSKIGTAIAYARVRGLEVPKIETYKMLCEMKNGDVFHGMTGKKFMYIERNRKIDRHVIYAISSGKYLEFIDTFEKYRMVE